MTPEYTSLPQFRSHSRHWRENFYVYPVISRRSGGLSIGINLNPDTACNFDCVYCQVDRSGPRRSSDVDAMRLAEELREMIQAAKSGVLFDDPTFADVPVPMRRVKDIAFSGDGEPTTCKNFRECVEVVAAVKNEAKLHETKIVLITDACYLTRPEVAAALQVLDENDGEIWAKLDAGTEGYYRRVNRPNYPLAHVIENITAASQTRAVIIQSLFMRLEGAGPDSAEITAFSHRLSEIIACGGQVALVQVYTIARRPAEDWVTPLLNAEVDAIVEQVRNHTGLRVEAYYGAGN